jgi:hypothetical protein
MNIEIYIQAAELIDSGKEEFSCNAIGRVLGEAWKSESEMAYYKLFMPEHYWGVGETFDKLHNDLYGEWASQKELREIRVFALLFAAEYFADFSE